jgi:ligand-binding SRPBCC domain-containing protein
MYLIERSQLVPAPLGKTFRFFEDPYDLAKITPGWLRLEIVKTDPPPVHAGYEIEYRIRWLGLSRRWHTLITEYEPGCRFVDV